VECQVDIPTLFLSALTSLPPMNPINIDVGLSENRVSLNPMIHHHSILPSEITNFGGYTPHRTPIEIPYILRVFLSLKSRSSSEHSWHSSGSAPLPSPACCRWPYPSHWRDPWVQGEKSLEFTKKSPWREHVISLEEMTPFGMKLIQIRRRSRSRRGVRGVAGSGNSFLSQQAEVGAFKL